jgi:hypothetical protein
MYEQNLHRFITCMNKTYTVLLLIEFTVNDVFAMCSYKVIAMCSDQ